MSNTPAEIAEFMAQVTDQGALELAKFLDKGGYKPQSNFVALNTELQREGSKPYDRVRILLGHAYDWYAYGN